MNVPRATVAHTKSFLYPLLLFSLTAAAQLDEKVEVFDVTEIRDKHAEIIRGHRIRSREARAPAQAAKAARIVHDANVLNTGNKLLAVELPLGSAVPVQVTAPFVVEDKNQEILALADAFLGAVGQVLEGNANLALDVGFEVGDFFGKPGDVFILRPFTVAASVDVDEARDVLVRLASSVDDGRLEVNVLAQNHGLDLVGETGERVEGVEARPRLLDLLALRNLLGLVSLLDLFSLGIGGRGVRPLDVRHRSASHLADGSGGTGTVDESLTVSAGAVSRTHGRLGDELTRHG